MTKYKIVLHLKEPTYEFYYWRDKYVEAKHLNEAKAKAKKLLVKQSERENRIFDVAYIFTKNSKGRFKVTVDKVSVIQKGVLEARRFGIKEWRLH